MRGTKLLGTLGSSATVAGSCARVAATNPMTPDDRPHEELQPLGSEDAPVGDEVAEGRMEGAGTLAAPHLRCPEGQRGGADTDAEKGRQSLGHIRQLPSPLNQTL
jgi:hypothetical protein